MPRFSVVIPVHNRAHLIARTIESVLKQPGEKCEIIVVDDGSTDDTLKVLSEFGKQIRVLTQKNSGPGAARNKGIEAATGDYVAFLDSDDLWLPWTLETYRQAIEEKGLPSMVMAKEFWFENEDVVETLEPEGAQFSHFKDYLATSQHPLWFGASSLIVRTETLRAVGGFVNQWMNGEDLDLCLRLGIAPNFVLIKAPKTFAYRNHPGSAVSDMTRTLQGVRHIIAQERGSLYPGGSRRRRERLEIVTRHVRPVALECLRHGYKSQGWQLYRQTFRWHALIGRAKFLVAFPLMVLKSHQQGVSQNRGIK